MPLTIAAALWALLALCLLLVDPAIAQTAQPPTQTTVKLDLSQDLVILLKFCVWAAAIFLALLAAIGIAFFGFDVRKARSSIVDATAEIRSLLTESTKLHAEVRDAHAKLLELKTKFETSVAEGERRIEELGAQIDELVSRPLDAQAPREEPNIPDGAPHREISDLIREVVQSGSFEWTTIGRLMKKTGLERDALLQVARAMRDIEISFGKKTGDHIFRLKRAG